MDTMVRGLSSNSCNRPENTCHQEDEPMQEENLHDPLGCEGHDMSCAYGIACDVPCMESKKIQHVLDSSYSMEMGVARLVAYVLCCIGRWLRRWQFDDRRCET